MHQFWVSGLLVENRKVGQVCDAHKYHRYEQILITSIVINFDKAFRDQPNEPRHTHTHTQKTKQLYYDKRCNNMNISVRATCAF